MLCCAPRCYFRNATDYGGVLLCPAHYEAVAEYVRLEPPQPKPVVYYIKRVDRPGQIKIGTTKDLPERLMALGRRGRTVTLLASEPGDIRVEKARHVEFGALRVDGEWFRGTDLLLDHVRHLRGDQLQ